MALNRFIANDGDLRLWRSEVLSVVTRWQHLVQCQPPDGSRLASGFLVGTDATIVFRITHVGKKRCYYKLLVHKLFLQLTYSDTQVSLPFFTNGIRRIIVHSLSLSTIILHIPFVAEALN